MQKNYFQRYNKDFQIIYKIIVNPYKSWNKIRFIREIFAPVGLKAVAQRSSYRVLEAHQASKISPQYSQT